MGIRDILSKFGEKSKHRKEMLRELDEQVRIRKIVEDRQLSSNERELNRLMDEEREEMIKERLEYLRKKKDMDIKFNHNPLDVKNVTNHTEWEVLKEKNLFNKNRNIFKNQKSVLKNNRNLLKNNKKMFSGRSTL